MVAALPGLPETWRGVSADRQDARHLRHGVLALHSRQALLDGTFDCGLCVVNVETVLVIPEAEQRRIVARGVAARLDRWVAHLDIAVRGAHRSGGGQPGRVG